MARIACGSRIPDIGAGLPTIALRFLIVTTAKYTLRSADEAVRWRVAVSQAAIGASVAGMRT
jgi:hypothetical protein